MAVLDSAHNVLGMFNRSIWTKAVGIKRCFRVCVVDNSERRKSHGPLIWNSTTSSRFWNALICARKSASQARCNHHDPASHKRTLFQELNIEVDHTSFRKQDEHDSDPTNITATSWEHVEEEAFIEDTTSKSAVGIAFICSIGWLTTCIIILIIITVYSKKFMAVASPSLVFDQCLPTKSSAAATLSVPIMFSVFLYQQQHKQVRCNDNIVTHWYPK